jgi:hypothetical protein
MAARKSGRDSAGHVDPYFQRRKRYETVFRTIGLDHSFARMPRRVQELFWQRKWPDPQIDFDHTFPTDRVGRAMRKWLEHHFRNVSIDLVDAVSDDSKTSLGPITVRDFFSVLMGCLLVVQSTEPAVAQQLGEEVAAFFRDARPRIERCYEQNMKRAIEAVINIIVFGLAAGSRLDERLFDSRIVSQPMPGGKAQPRTTITATPAQQRYLRIDGERRPVYRVVRNMGLGVDWLSWNAAELSIGQRELPVYAQSHALRMLQERVNLPAAAPFLQAWMARSLAEPRIVERQGRNLLVEYQIRGHRLGYLLATPLEDAVVVRTFLFLTMQGTPEARALDKRLRLTRSELDYLRLTELSPFTQSDLRNDAKLRGLLEKCGCGHLFAAAELTADAQGIIAPPTEPMAEKVRKYLRIAA